LEPIRVHFPGSGTFHRELKRRVAAYFEGVQVSQRDAAWMYLKSAILIAWSVGAYLLMITGSLAWWQYPIAAVALAAGMAGIGVSVQHDANHGGYSKNRWVNRLFGCCLDVMGGSSYIWYWKHNIVHHTYTNISGIDVDVDIEPFLRLAPDQPLLKYHKYQYLYVWLLYGLLPANWQFYADYRDLVNSDIGGKPFPRPSKPVLIATLFGKAFFYFWSLILPLLLYPTLPVLGLYVLTSFTLGTILTTMFQMAHCLEETEVHAATHEANTVEAGWAEHQVRTTANFAPRNRLLTWYLGGLNYQIEHHLFPKVCHVHYPAISPIVEATCKDFGIPYQVHPTFRAAVASHIRWLYRLGRMERTSVSTAAPAAPAELVTSS
jgi:linoleoyl-CoA desaturase